MVSLQGIIHDLQLNAYHLNNKRKLLTIRLVRPYLVRKVRNKKQIKALFILHSLGSWKTELLFKAMLKHPRFSPFILVTHTRDENSEEEIIDYLNRSGYQYGKLEPKEKISKKFNPDIIFYQKAYDYHWFDNRNLYHYNNIRSLGCYVHYAFHSISEKWSLDAKMHNAMWQSYFENEISTEGIHEMMRNHGKNVLVTGMPQMDEFLKDKSSFADPWKQLPGNRKRIIWAPHHSIETEGGILHYSNFLEIADDMIRLAKKYQDEVQFAFKPHPILRTKLYRLWGKERTDAYYSEWATMENCQIETGEYVGLFKHSDAMVHDSCSFQIEYHYTKNPVLFIVKNEEEHVKELNQFARKAFELHYKTTDLNGIEEFINNVISGVDPGYKEREKFYEESLCLPYGTSACENIINAILGND